MKTQSCSSAQPPANTAGPKLRAGFTEVFVTGMLMRWIRASVRPMASGASPAGARPSVAPWITSTKTKVSTTSMMIAAVSEYPAGEWSP